MARDRAFKIQISAVAQMNDGLDFDAIVDAVTGPAKKSKSTSIRGFVYGFAVKHIIPRYYNIIRTWYDYPSIEEDNMLSFDEFGEWEILNVYPNPEEGEVDKFFLLNEGFMRTVPVSKDFIPKTAPRRLRSIKGRGRALVRQRLETPKPVEAREFIDEMMKELNPLFMRMAANNFKRLLDEIDKAGYRTQTWGARANVVKQERRGASLAGTRKSGGAHKYPPKRRPIGGPRVNARRGWKRLDEPDGVGGR